MVERKKYDDLFQESQKIINKDDIDCNDQEIHFKTHPSCHLKIKRINMIDFHYLKQKQRVQNIGGKNCQKLVIAMMKSLCIDCSLIINSRLSMQ
ncbi:uncharacterized protein LOC124813689 isoform X2 [Hydra vulgaris]|uniref:uncharacterized protein LOC124813689 isoform X2 n=1 Tax=Hydra vulgaris TaxID=6087 RepID=UPI001F5E5032|nr:uncharacterized protein LOC124813689 isoform X2 [Hydra vulgaris]